jgi:very-short-patch-repair endonuclease
MTVLLGRPCCSKESVAQYVAVQATRDARRTSYLLTQRLTVLRFTNIEVLTQTRAVLDEILLAVEGATNPSP